MLKFIGKRLLMMIPVLLGVVLLVFTMMHFSPGRSASFILGELATEAELQNFEHNQGLDKPFFVQYISYVGDAVRGDLGTSWTSKQPVIGEIMARFPNTFRLATLCIIFSTIVGVTLGIISATKQYSITDNIVRVVSIIGVSMPSFWEGLMLIIFFSVYLKWLPASGFSTWQHYVLPVITVGTVGACNIMRMTRSSMLEAIRQDYIRTARAKGQSERVVIWKHALKNALIPIITTVGLTFARTLGGMAIGETVFAIAGVGKLVVDAIKLKNAPLVQGGILFIAVAVSVVNLLTDVVYAYADPRIRSQYISNKSSKSKPANDTAKAGK